MKKIITLLLTVLVALSLISCIDEKDNQIHVVATAIPHEEILIEAIPLLKEKGYDLNITIISDYSLGNPAVANQSADANFFQHLPYLNAYNNQASSDKKLVNVGAIHIEPIGLYSGTKTSITNIADGDIFIISDNAPDYGRIVQFLKNINLVEVVDDFDPQTLLSNPNEAIKSKVKNFDFQIIEASLLVAARNNQEGAFFFINGNYALEGGLTLDDVLISEPTDNNIYVNVIAVLEKNQNDPKILALVEVLKSDTIKNFIINRYNGAVIPA